MTGVALPVAEVVGRGWTCAFRRLLIVSCMLAIVAVTLVVTFFVKGRSPRTLIGCVVRRSSAPPWKRRDAGRHTQNPQGSANAPPPEPEGPSPGDILVWRLGELAVTEAIHHGKMQDAQQVGRLEELRDKCPWRRWKSDYVTPCQTT